MEHQPDRAAAIKKLGELIEDIKIAMLTTVEEDGSLRSRPMGTQQVEFDGELALGAATVKYKAKSQGLARREQKDLVIPFSPSWTYTSALAPLLNRTLPVSLPPGLAPTHQTRTLRITAPAGYQFGELPPGGAVEGGEFGKASLDVTRDPKDPKTVIVKRSVSFDMHLVPVEKYAAWRAFLQKIDALMHRSVRAIEDGGGGAGASRGISGGVGGGAPDVGAGGAP